MILGDAGRAVPGGAFVVFRIADMALCLLALSIVLMAGCSESKDVESCKQQRLNILYIMTDQQPLGGVGAYGNPVVKTPELDTLARSGCVFDQLYIVAFPCSPSRTSQLSGRYPYNHGVTQNDVLFDEKVPCLGDICKAAGYQTAYFGKWHLGGNMYRVDDQQKADNVAKTEGLGSNWYRRPIPSKDGFKYEEVPGGLGEDAPQHGFDTWVGGWKQYRDYLKDGGFEKFLGPASTIGNHNDAPSGKEGTHIYSLLPQEHHVDAFLARQTEQFVRGRAANAQPWCAVLSFYGPHLPVAPPQPWDTMYSLEEVTLPPNHYDELKAKPVGQRNNKHCYVLPKWKDEQYKDYIRRYWGYCSFIDQEIGRVFKALRDTNQWDNTIIVFTTDHGDMVGAHGMIYKLTACGYEELFHIPAIIRIPGVTKPGTRTDALVSNIDVLPTLLEAAHISLPDGIDGSSVLPLLKGQTNHHRDIVFSDAAEKNFVCFDGHYKFVLNIAEENVNELYDLKTDPGEMRNLANHQEHKATADKMQGQILSWLRETKHPYVDVIAKQTAAKTQLVKPK